MKHHKPPPEPLYTAKDIARLIGVPSAKAVYAMHARGEIPGGIRIGARRLRFDPDAIRSWLSKLRASSPTGESR